MNWVGGIRNRIRMQNDRKQQKEFFERKKFTTTVRRTGRSPPRMANQHLSMDLMSLRTIHDAHSNKTPDKANPAAERKIRRVDLKEHKSHIRMIDNLDNHISPVKQQSRIQIMDSKESIRLETKERKPNQHNSSFEDSYARQMAPVQDTPVGQIFYTHGGRPPNGVRKIPPGLVDEIKRRNKRDHEMSDSSSFQEGQSFKRRHDMIQMVTKEDLFPTPVIKKEKRVQITSTATWIPDEERIFQPYSKPAPSSLITEMKTLEKQEVHRIAQEQHSSLWSTIHNRQDADRFGPKEPMVASTAPNFHAASEIPGASLEPYHRHPLHQDMGASYPPQYNVVLDDFRSRKKSNHFESENFQITPLRKYMPREPHKDSKHELKNKRLKRKHQDEKKDTHANECNNDELERRTSPYRLTTIDILDDAKFNKLQPRLNPISQYRKEMPHTQRPNKGAIAEHVESTTLLKRKQERETEIKASKTHDDNTRKRPLSPTPDVRFKLPKDFKPLHESTPKMTGSGKETENRESSYKDETFRYRQTLTAMLFGTKEPERSPAKREEFRSETSVLKDTEVLKTPERNIPQAMRERGCLTSPITTSSKQQNTLRLQNEWSQMIKLAKNSKENPGNKIPTSQQDNKIPNVKTSSESTTAQKHTDTIREDKANDDTPQEGPIDLTWKKKTPVELKRVEKIREKAVISDSSSTEVILDFTFNKSQVTQPREAVLPNIHTANTRLYEVHEETKRNSISEKKESTESDTFEEREHMSVPNSVGKPQIQIIVAKVVDLTQKNHTTRKNPSPEVPSEICGRSTEKGLKTGDTDISSEGLAQIPKDDVKPKEPSPELPSAIREELSVKIGNSENTDEKVSYTTNATKEVETVSVGIQAYDQPTLKDSWSQYTSEITEKVKVSTPMANQFCQTEQDVANKAIQCVMQGSSSTGTQTECELKTFKDTASSPIKFEVEEIIYPRVPMKQFPTFIAKDTDPLIQNTNSSVAVVPENSTISRQGVGNIQIPQSSEEREKDRMVHSRTDEICEDIVFEITEGVAEIRQVGESASASARQSSLEVSKTDKSCCERETPTEKIRSKGGIDFSALLDPDSPSLSLSFQLSPEAKSEKSRIKDAERSELNEANDEAHEEIIDQGVSSSTMKASNQGNSSHNSKNEEIQAPTDVKEPRPDVLLEKSECLFEQGDLNHIEQPDSTVANNNSTKVDCEDDGDIETIAIQKDEANNSNNDEGQKSSPEKKPGLTTEEYDMDVVLQISESPEISPLMSASQNKEPLVVPQTDSENEDNGFEGDIKKLTLEGAKQREGSSLNTQATSIDGLPEEDINVDDAEEKDATVGERFNKTGDDGDVVEAVEKCSDVSNDAEEKDGTAGETYNKTGDNGDVVEIVEKRSDVSNDAEEEYDTVGERFNKTGDEGDVVEAVEKSSDVSNEPQCGVESTVVNGSDGVEKPQEGLRTPEVCATSTLSDEELYDNVDNETMVSEESSLVDDKEPVMQNSNEKEEDQIVTQILPKVLDINLASKGTAVVENMSTGDNKIETIGSTPLQKQNVVDVSENVEPGSETENVIQDTEIRVHNESGLEYKAEQKLKSKRLSIPYCESSQTQDAEVEDSTTTGTQPRRSRRLQKNNYQDQLNYVTESQSREEFTPELTLPQDKEDSKENVSENALDSSKGYLSDWVSNVGGNEIKFSGKTYERVNKKEQCSRGKTTSDKVNTEYELVKMIAFQEDYEYLTSSTEDSGPGSPVFEIASGNKARSLISAESHVSDGESDMEASDEEIKLADGKEEKIVVSDFENELLLLDGKSESSKADSAIKEIKKDTLKSRDEKKVPMAHIEDCNVSKDTIQSVGEQYDTAEEYEEEIR